MSILARLETLLQLTSLRRKLVAWLFVPLLVILALTALLILRTYWQVTEELVMERNQELTRLLAKQIGAELERYVELLEQVAEDAEVVSLDPARLSAALERHAGSLSDLDGGVVILDPVGRVVAADPRRLDTIGEDWSGRSYFQRVASEPIPLLLSDVESVGVSGDQVVSMAVQMQSGTGEALGVIAGMFRLQPEGSSALFRSIVRLDLRIESTISVVDSRGVAVYHNSPELIGTSIAQEPAVQTVLKGRVGALRTADEQGNQIIASFSPISDSLCYLIEEESWADLRAVSLRHSPALVALLSLGLFLPLLAVGMGVRRITRPIVALTQAARQMADGDLTQRVAVPDQSEIGVLAVAFNRMSADLQELYHDLERRVEDRTRELSAINAVASVVSRSLDLVEILNAALDKVLEVTGMDAGTSYRLDQTSGELHLIAAKGLSAEAVRDVTRMPLEFVIDGQYAIQSPLVRLIGEFPEGPLRELLKSEGWGLAVTVPLIARETLMGIMNLRTYGPREFSSESLALLSAIGDQVGVAMDNAQLYERAAELAVAAERTRLAQELHDSVTQTLFSANLLAGVVPLLWVDNPPEAEVRLRELKQLTQGALAEMRALLLELRPNAMLRMPLATIFGQLAEAIAARARITVASEVQVELQLPGPVRTALYRIAQEALNNVVKHADASSARVSLREVSQDGTTFVELCVEDDGVGFDTGAVPPGHLGLEIMRERAEESGLELRIESEPGRGSRVIARWPLPA